MMNDTRRLFLGGLFVVLTTGFAGSATAMPVLQLYIDGADYDTVTKTWITTDSTFDLWVIGDRGSYGQISDVMLSAAVNTDETGSDHSEPHDYDCHHGSVDTEQSDRQSLHGGHLHQCGWCDSRAEQWFGPPEP